MALEDVDKKSKNRTSKWKNLLKSRKYVNNLGLIEPSVRHG